MDSIEEDSVNLLNASDEKFSDIEPDVIGGLRTAVEVEKKIMTLLMEVIGQSL